MYAEVEPITVCKVPQPKFNLNECVRVATQVDRGVLCESGIITGFLYRPEGWDVTGWVYQIDFYCHDSPWLPVPYRDLVVEEEVSLDDR
jgi:hypothetical protein